MTDCRKQLTRDPVPLYSDTCEIALLWNAKAACTFAIKWLFFQDGVLDEALAYSAWPHRYRRLVFCKRPGYRDKVRSIPDLGARAVKIVRNPFDRAVGGYLSYCQQVFEQTSSQHTPMLRAISAHLGRTVGAGRSFTFREWVGFLNSLDLDRADIHVRRQLHPCEVAGALPDLTVIRAEESTTRVPEVEDALGLRRSDVASLSRSRHHTAREPSDAFVGDTPFGGVIGTPVPASSAFYDEELEARVRRLYAADLEAYGYDSPG